MKTNRPVPPLPAQRFLNWFLRDEIVEEVQGDLEEQFYQRLKKNQPFLARLNYWYQVFNYLRPFAIRNLKSTNANFYIMFRHNFIISARNLKRNKSYATINIVGLALGIAGAIVIITLIKYHLGFDTFHTNADRTYRIITEFHQEDIRYASGVPAPLGAAFHSDFDFAKKVAMVTHLPDRLITVPSFKDKKKFKETIAFAGPDFFDILDFPLVNGNKNTILSKPNSAILTERIAEKFFGGEDPLGQTIRIDNKLDFVITGILEDLPANTDRRQEIYFSYFNLREHSPGLDQEGWWYSVNNGRQCFVLLKPGVSPAEVDKALVAMSEKYYDERNAKYFQFKTQPLPDIHFNTDLGGYIEKKNLWALALIGLFLVITACANFVNLATAQALKRSKEIGVRKALGGLRRQLFWQFMGETTLISILALGTAAVLIHFALPHINQLFQTRLSINVLQDGHLFAFLSLLLLMVVFFSGAYPALIMAGFKPVLALKGRLTQQHLGGLSLRRGLVLTQFAISQLLVISTIIIANQMRYTQHYDMGFEKDAIVMFPLPVENKSALNTLHTQFSQITGVEQVTFCNFAPAAKINPGTGIKFDTRTESENFSIYLRAGDPNYVPTFGLQIVEGRNLLPSDTIREYLINEITVTMLGLSSNHDVIGKTATINGKTGTIVGVVKDFHNRSFHKAKDPVYLTTSSSNYFNTAVKVNPANLRPTLTALEKVWKEVYPDHIYEYNFVDEKIATLYKQDNLILRLIWIFAGIAIIIGCLGLYGLVSFMAAQKRKEVGVRKVMGADIKNILWQFGREFNRLLLIAFAMSAPLAWWIMNNWLENFEYRVEIGVDVFLLAILVTMMVAIITVGYKSLKAALMNPVQCLKDD